jgi:hypothetical protein
MPLQNRVTPFGNLIAVPDRGTFMGNRGILHDAQRQIVREFKSYKAWIICLTEFKGRKRELMQPGLYTELFFLDEATALAAGHRPCGECRRVAFRQFKEVWLAGNPEAGLDATSKIRMIDNILHRERLTADGKKNTYQATIRELPDGVFASRGDGDAAFLLWHGKLHRWTPTGYRESLLVDPDELVDVLTPRSIVNAIGASFRPVFHSSLR